MFALFFSLYYSMFYGSWTLYSYANIFNPTGNPAYERTHQGFNDVGTFITSIFNDGVTFDNLGDLMNGGTILYVLAFVLALITSIGIVVMAVKGVKKAFGIFFMGIR